MKLKDRAKKIYGLLLAEYPGAKTELDFSNPLQLLVATILSAQCTDKRVNIVTARLFKKYGSAAAFAKADTGTLEQEIRSTGFFRNKARNIIACCKEIDRKYGGKVPSSMDELTGLPGIGRKTANVILGNVFGIPGIVVDTHVIRLSGRIGLTEETDPVKIEFDLMKIVGRNDRTMFSHLLVFHGRSICKARNPACYMCKIEKICSYTRKTKTP
ncbi:MAG: endonuclease III [bacterium]|nr:endonuclease III [bacterium]